MLYISYNTGVLFLRKDTHGPGGTVAIKYAPEHVIQETL